MAGEQKVKVDIGSASDFLSELTKGISNAFTQASKDAAKNLASNKTTQKDLDKAFSMDGLKKNLIGSVKEGLAGTEKAKAKQAQMGQILAKNASLSKQFTDAIAGGASKGQVLSKGLALAANSGMGMLKNMNPYVAALKVGVELIKQFAKYYQRTLENSKKFITQGSLFTDKNTMDMMQRTGQSASGAQGTNRALDRLGISFDDIQTGKVTKAQMEAFEQIRKEETARLEEIARVGGPVFEAMQRGALAMARAKQIVDDTMTLAFAKGKGILEFSKQLTGTANQFADMFSNMGPLISAIANIVGGVLAVAMNAAGTVMEIVGAIFEALGPIYETINGIINVIMEAVGGILEIVGRLVTSLLKPAVTLIKVVMSQLMKPINSLLAVVSAVIEVIMAIVTPLLDIVNIFSDMTSSFYGMFEATSGLSPILQIIITSLKIVGAAIGWVISKIGQGIKWVWDSAVDFINKMINAVPKGIHTAINAMIGEINKAFNLEIFKPLGDYKAVDLGDLFTGLNTGLNNVLTTIQGDTFNYNTNEAAPVTQTANTNLFANMYVLVND